MLEAFECFRLAFSLHFDSPFRDVADPAVHSLTNGRGLREESEPDSLDAATDEVPSREAHDREGRQLYTVAPTPSLGCRRHDEPGGRILLTHHVTPMVARAASAVTGRAAVWARPTSIDGAWGI
jgi:hypothetical protein